MTGTQPPRAQQARTIAGRTRRALTSTRLPATDTATDVPVTEAPDAETPDAETPDAEAAGAEEPIADAPVVDQVDAPAEVQVDDAPQAPADLPPAEAALDTAPGEDAEQVEESPGRNDADLTDLTDTLDAEVEATDTDVTDPDTDVTDPDAAPVLDLDDGTHPTRPRRRIDKMTAVTATAAVAAAIFAGIAAGVWWGTSGDTHTVLGWHAEVDTGSAVGQARDAAMLAARQDVITLNSADYQHATTSVNAWKNVATGTLLSSITGSPTLVKTIADSKFTTTAAISDAAMTTLDTSKGTASVIASVVLDRKQAGGGTDSIRIRLRADMQRVHGNWMLADLAPVTVSLG